MSRTNFDNFRACISRVNSKAHTRGRNLIPKVVLSDATDAVRTPRWLTWRENAAGATTEPVRNGQMEPDPRVLAVTISEWRLHVWLCGAFHILIVRLSVSLARVRTARRISPTPRRRPLLLGRENRARGTYGDDLWEKGHHENHRGTEDDASGIARTSQERDASESEARTTTDGSVSRRRKA